IERFDREGVAPLVEDAGVEEDCRLAVLADSFPLSPEEERQGAAPLPFVVADRIEGVFQAPPARGGLAGLWRALRGGKGPPEDAGFSERLADGAQPIRAEDLFSDILRVSAR
ncbi:MAG: hypothetical protein O2807_10420, partial [bacterium]|nr:hypothetical protein [bacterium]